MTENRFFYPLFVVFTLLFLGACDQEASEITQKTVVRPVKLLTLEQASNQESRRFPAIIDAAQSSTLSFQVSGLLLELLVNEAEEVKQGDILAKLDSRDFKSNLDSAQAQFNNAEAEYQRAVRLAKEDAIAKNVLEQRKSQRDITKAQLDSAQKALSDTVLRAPFSGIIAKVPVERLQTIQAGNPAITIISANQLEATVSLPSSIIVTAASRTDKSAFVILESAPDKRIRAEYKEVVLEADSVSQTYEVTFTFTPPEELTILPGMNATIILSSSDQSANGKERIAVPLAAVMSDGAQQYLWVVDRDTMTVSKRAIEIEEGVGETVVVTKGLVSSETIVGAGGAYLAEGMQVRPWSSQ